MSSWDGKPNMGENNIVNFINSSLTRFMKWSVLLTCMYNLFRYLLEKLPFLEKLLKKLMAYLEVLIEIVSPKSSENDVNLYFDVLINVWISMLSLRKGHVARNSCKTSTSRYKLNFDFSEFSFYVVIVIWICKCCEWDCDFSVFFSLCFECDLNFQVLWLWLF